MEDFKHWHGQLIEAVERLTQPRWIVNLRGETMEVLPLVYEVQTALSGVRTATPSAPAFRTRPPLWLPALDWTQGLRDACASAASAVGQSSVLPTGDNSPEVVTAVLETVAHSVPWSPEHSEAVKVLAEKLAASYREGIRLAYPPLFTVQSPCPACGEKNYVRDSVKHPALSVHEWWAECGACGTVWEEDQIGVLAEEVRLVGTEAPEA